MNGLRWHLILRAHTENCQVNVILVLVNKTQLPFYVKLKPNFVYFIQNGLLCGKSANNMKYTFSQGL